MPALPKSVHDPIVEAQIARSLARYAGLVTPAMMATLREVLEDALTTHPVALKLVDSLRERVVPDASSTVPKVGALAGEAAEATRDAKVGGTKGAP
jgi:hypothetical protein